MIPSSRTNPGLDRRQANRRHGARRRREFRCPRHRHQRQRRGRPSHVMSSASQDVIGLAVARLVEIDMWSCFNPAPPVCLATEGVCDQRHESRGRAETLFDQVIWRFLRRFGATVTDNRIQVNCRRSEALTHSLSASHLCLLTCC